jgi:hypothetical protein
MQVNGPLTSPCTGEAIISGGQSRAADFIDGQVSALRSDVVCRYGPLPTGMTHCRGFSRSTWSRTAARASRVATDIATGWTECVPLLIREGTFVVEALLRVRSLLPFPLRGVDFDNDSGS